MDTETFFAHVAYHLVNHKLVTNITSTSVTPAQRALVSPNLPFNKCMVHKAIMQIQQGGIY